MELRLYLTLFFCQILHSTSSVLENLSQSRGREKDFEKLKHYRKYTRIKLFA